MYLQKSWDSGNITDQPRADLKWRVQETPRTLNNSCWVAAMLSKSLHTLFWSRRRDYDKDSVILDTFTLIWRNLRSYSKLALKTGEYPYTQQETSGSSFFSQKRLLVPEVTRASFHMSRSLEIMAVIGSEMFDTNISLSEPMSMQTTRAQKQPRVHQKPARYA